MLFFHHGIDPETHEETKSTVPYALHMDQTSLVMTLHGFGNVIDDTFHSTFKRLFAPIFTKAPYAENEEQPKKEEKEFLTEALDKTETETHTTMGPVGTLLRMMDQASMNPYENIATSSNAANPKWMAWIGDFHDYCVYHWQIKSGWHSIIKQTEVCHVPIRVHEIFFVQCPS